MKDFDRFTEFLVREAAGYNEPPETPAGAMWPGVAVRLGSAGRRGREREKPRVVVAGGETLVDSVGYNEPPPAPRDEMWTRIESAWALRRAAGVSRLRPAWLGQRGAAGWVAALAAAASLVLGIGLGRGTRPSATDETVIPPVGPAPAEMVRRVQTAPVAVAEPEPQETEDPGEPIRTAAISGQVTVAARRLRR